MPLTAEQVDEIANLHRYGNPRSSIPDVIERLGAYISTTDAGYPPDFPIVNHTTLQGYTGVKAAFEAAASGDVIEIVYKPTVLPTGGISTSVPFVVFGNNVELDFAGEVWQASGNLAGMKLYNMRVVNAQTALEVPVAAQWGVGAGGEFLIQDCYFSSIGDAFLFQEPPLFQAEVEEPPSPEIDWTLGVIRARNSTFIGASGWQESSTQDLETHLEDCRFEGVSEAVAVQSGDTISRKLYVTGCTILQSGAGVQAGLHITAAGLAEFADIRILCPRIEADADGILISNDLTQAELDTARIKVDNLVGVSGYGIEKPNGGTGALADLPLTNSRVFGGTAPFRNLTLSPGNSTNWLS